MLDFNRSPYYDDFDADKNFHKILFKPGVSVQARELTQSQSILQDQILKFGNHIFKHGSVVIPGNSGSDLSASYVKLNSLSTSELAQLENTEGAKITGQTTGVTAIIRKTIRPEGSDPATLYVQYTSQGTSGEAVFDDGEILTITGFFTVETIELGATGLGSLAFVNDGVYYVHGNFVTVHKQFIPIEKYSQKPSKHILLKISEEIVDSDVDETLLDPAQGSYNFSAPGADRYKITLSLVTLPLGATIENDYFELMRYNNGVLEEHSRYPKYNELEKSLARRTFDESGDYVVTGLNLSANEHLKSGFNGGIYSELEGGNRGQFVVSVSPGKAYIRGFENEKLATSLLTLDKGRTVDHIKTQSNIGITPEFGQFVYVSALASLPNFLTRETVNLVGLGGRVLGTAKVLSIDLHVASSVASRNIFKLFLYDVNITGSTMSDVVGITKTAGGAIASLNHKLSITNTGSADFAPGDALSLRGVTLGTVVNYSRLNGSLYYIKTGASTPKPADIVLTGTTKSGTVNSLESIGNMKDNTSIVRLPFDATYRVRRADNTVDMTYSVYKTVTISLVGGTGSASISGAVMVSFDQADPVAVHATAGYLNLTSDNVTISDTTITLTGLSAVPNGNVTVTVIANKNLQTNRAKTLITNVETRTAASKMTLQKCDIYRIVSIVETSSGLDYKAAYSLDNGQRDYAYTNGELNLIGVAPIGNVVITYQFFQHSGNGDYFSADSYETSGLGADYYDKIPEYRSRTDGQFYNLKNCLDFRTRINSPHPLDTSLSDLVVIGARLTTSSQYYVPRIDVVGMNKSGVLLSVRGLPSESPLIPLLPADTLLLGTVDIPAYTARLSDIQITRAKNQGYTMSEISSIEDRIFRLEQYSLLNQSEQSLINTEIIDAGTGLTRFKSGYLVETFDNPDMISDVFNEDFSATYVNGVLFPKIEHNEVTLIPTTLDNVATAANYVCLPFTEVVFAQQNVSSRVTNVNPFAVYTWTGVMTLTPSSDSWVETEFLPTIFNETVKNETVEVTVNRPWNWQLPASQQTVAVPTFAPAPLAILPAPVIAAPLPRIGASSGGLSGLGSGLGGIGGGFGGGMGGGGGGGGGGFGGCFTPQTLVELSSGEKVRIDQVKVGDMVWNWNKTRTNQVKFIEKMCGEHLLFTPNTRAKPFATDNHPLYINGKLSTVIKNSNYTKWLGEMEIIKSAKFESFNGTVYNLWVTGDNTYIVNGFGTTSIVGDGGWMTEMFEQNKLKSEEIIDIMIRVSEDKYSQFGALFINNKIRNSKNQTFNTILAKILRKDSMARKLAFSLFGLIGKQLNRERN
jgi:hypothetical protein